MAAHEVLFIGVSVTVVQTLAHRTRYTTSAGGTHGAWLTSCTSVIGCGTIEATLANASVQREPHLGDIISCALMGVCGAQGTHHCSSFIRIDVFAL